MLIRSDYEMIMGSDFCDLLENNNLSLLKSTSDCYFYFKLSYSFFLSYKFISNTVVYYLRLFLSKIILSALNN